MVLQQPTIAAQTVLSDRDAPIGVSLLQFQSLLGGTIFVTFSQTLLQTKLASGSTKALPGFDSRALSNSAATAIRNIPDAQHPVVLKIYNESVRSIWYLTIGLATLVFLASFGMEWKSVHSEKKQQSCAALHDHAESYHS